MLSEMRVIFKAQSSSASANRKGRALVRFALFLVSASAANAAIAGTCTASIGYKEFDRRGGKIVHETQIDLTNLPYDFFCDRPACTGVVRFSGLIDQSGKVRDLRVVTNTWDYRPAKHAAFIRDRALAVRYRPPRLNGRPVCVKMVWRYLLKDGPS
jgi:hypothetical protein